MRHVTLVLIAVCLSPTACGQGEALRPVPVFELGGADQPLGWSQWGQNAQHHGRVNVPGQNLDRIIARVRFDPFAEQEKEAENGDILIHYQSPLVDDTGLFMSFKSGRFVPEDWNTQQWGEKHFVLEGDALVEKWSFASDWKPVPYDETAMRWEPAFHAALAGAYVVVPGARGTMFVLNRDDGSVVTRVDPFEFDRRAFVASPLTVDPAGNVYYTVMMLNPTEPWKNDIRGAWLVKVEPHGNVVTASFASLTPGAPGPADRCSGTFALDQLPWPPAPDAHPPTIECGSQRPGINAAPAVAPDGTVYTVSRSHYSSQYAYLLAVNPDLSLKWAVSLRDQLKDGCGTATWPPNGTPGGCREGSAIGVDPATNLPPAGQVRDTSTASPVVAPDGTILYGAYTRYNHARGHLMRFSPAGAFLGSFDFGWDVTPAIYAHDGSYSVIVKENNYGAGTYCNHKPECPPGEDGPYYITQLSADLVPEWRFASTNPLSCGEGADGTVTCVPDHPNGFEWCINAPAVDENGVVYVNGEDGVLYAIAQGGQTAPSIFLSQALGAAYTPLAIDASGRIYAENYGELFVVGE